METVARTFSLLFFFLFCLVFRVIFISPSHFASQDTANHVLDGIYLIDRLTRALFHTHFRRHVRYHGLLMARCMGYNAISPTVGVTLTCRVFGQVSRSTRRCPVNLTRLVFMDFDFRCNRLSCRKSLTDKAVVTTCSHIFCVDCANELFGASRLCPACETSLVEPDDVVVSSLHPSNDYKTSVLSGLNPATILEICSRAISFWQYQIHQEHSFQHAVVRSINDKNAQLQKQLENLVREADSEIGLLSNKLSDLERDLDLERRKNRDLQETSRERDKEYQKLKAQYDKLKRRALLAPTVGTNQPGINLAGGPELHPGVGVGVGVGVSGMNTIQRPAAGIVNRTAGQFNTPGLWSQTLQQHQQPQPQQQHISPQNVPPPVRQPFIASERSLDNSERSNTAQDVEELLGSQGRMQRRTHYQGGWASSTNQAQQQQQRAFAPSSGRRTSGTFRPGGKGK